MTLPVEKCPWCGGEMEQGFLSGGRGVYWTRGVPDTKTKWLGAGMENQLRVDEEGALFTYRTAWLCPTCRKLAADLSDASDTPEGRTQEEYIEELRGYAEQAKTERGRKLTNGTALFQIRSHGLQQDRKRPDDPVQL